MIERRMRGAMIEIPRVRREKNLKEKQKIACTTIFVIVLLSSLSLAPTVYASRIPTASPKEQLRTQIEDGFGDYMRKQNMRIEAGKSLEIAFQAFLRANPQFRNYLSEYANLTKADRGLKTPVVPDISNAQIEPVFKTVVSTINGTNYQVKYSYGESADGQNFLKISFCGNGTDPWSWITITYLTIDLFGWVITYGELQEWTQAYLTQDEALSFLDFFDTVIFAGGGAATFLWALFGIIGNALAPGAAVAIAAAEIAITDTNLALYHSKVHGANSEEPGEGLWIKTVNTYHYPLYVPFVCLSDFQVYVKQFFNQGNWALAFPVVGSYWMMATPLMNEVNAWIMSEVIHGIGDAGGYDEWDWIPDPPTPPTGPPSGPTGLHSVTVNGYDTTHSTGLNDAHIEMDSFDIGTTGSTFTMTPETHAIEGVHLPHFFYENIAGYPPEEPEGPTIVEITSNVTITMNYVAKAPLYVCALEPYTGIVDTNIYSSGQLIGVGELYTEVPVGTYTISVDYQTVHWGETVTIDYIMVNEEFYSYGDSIEISLSETYTEITFVYRFGCY
jgi:hypothetical protein